MTMSRKLAGQFEKEQKEQPIVLSGDTIYAKDNEYCNRPAWIPHFEEMKSFISRRACVAPPMPGISLGISGCDKILILITLHSLLLEIFFNEGPAAVFKNFVAAETGIYDSTVNPYDIHRW